MKKKRIMATVFAAVMTVSAAMVPSVSVAASNASSFKYPMDGKTKVTYWLDLNTNVSANYKNLGDTPWAKSLQQKTGVNVEFLHPASGQAREQLNLMVASGDLPDIVEHAWLSYPGGPEKAISEGTILRLNDTMTKYAPLLTSYLAKNKEIDKMVKTDQGSYYVFPFIRGDKELLTSIGPVFRKDWLDSLGLRTPTTVDEWYTALKGFKEKKGAKAPLTYEYGGGNSAQIQNHPITYAYNTKYDYYLRDGKVVFGAVEDSFKDYLATMAKWYAEGLLDPDIATITNAQVSAKITNGDSGATMTYAGSGMGSFIPAGQKLDPKYDLVGVPYPTLKKGDKPEMGHYDNPYVGSASAAITKKCKKVEAAARLLDFGYSEEGRIFMNFGTEGVSYTMVNGEPVYTKDVMENAKGWPLGQSLAAHIRGNYNGPMIQDIRYLLQYLQMSQQKNAYKSWGATNASTYKIPPITSTTAESTEFAKITNEIDTYRNEMILKFILGQEKIEKFPDYVATIEKLGLKRALEIQNAALDRYNKR